MPLQLSNDVIVTLIVMMMAMMTMMIALMMAMMMLMHHRQAPLPRLRLVPQQVSTDTLPLYQTSLEIQTGIAFLGIYDIFCRHFWDKDIFHKRIGLLKELSLETDKSIGTKKTLRVNKTFNLAM